MFPGVGSLRARQAQSSRKRSQLAHVHAASDTPIRIGNINSYTGGLAYAGENNLNGMNLYFDSVGWTVAGP